MNSRIETLISKFKSFVESKNGTVAGIDKWGLKKLAYPISFKTEGFYVWMNYASEAEVSTSMESLMRITDGILRAIVVRK